MKKKLIVSALLFIIVGNANAQKDLYDFENSKRFGEYLLKSGQYELATKEYERLVFFKPQSDSLKLNLLKAYRLSNKYETGILRGLQLYPTIATMPSPQAIEYSKLLMSHNDWQGAYSFWEESKTMSDTDKRLFQTSASIFNKDFERAKTYLISLPDTSNLLAIQYNRIVEEGVNGRYKSPFLAGALSTVVPGLGRTYTGDWKDGIVSLIFTAGMAFQSYRGFRSDQGIKSTKGWIYGGIGLGFYLGNIYGSVKSAKNKNAKKINQLQHEASTYFNAYYN